MQTAITPEERRDLGFGRGAAAEVAMLISSYLLQTLPAFSTTPSPAEWMLDKVTLYFIQVQFDFIKVRVFTSAKAPLLVADSRMDHQSVAMASFRMATLQAREMPRRYDCVSAVDSLSSTPNTVFRAQVLAFFKAEDVTFCLLGTYRTIRHHPYQTETMPGSTVTREQLLGGAGHLLIAFPPNHESMEPKFLNKYQTQRFKIVGLGDLKASAHIIPLSNKEGDPLVASFQPDSKMHETIPGATPKFLYYLNTCIY